MLDQTEFPKYEKIPHLEEASPHLLDGEVHIFEKLDGGLVRLRYKDGRLIPGSKGREINPQLNTDSTQLWMHDFAAFAWKHLYKGMNALGERVVIYGEWMTPTAILQYPDDVQNHLYLNDILDLDSRRFLSPEDAEFLIEAAGFAELIRINPPIAVGQMDKVDLEPLMQDSNYGVEKKEGIVIKNYQATPQLFAKWVNQEFVDKRTDMSLEVTDPPGKVVQYFVVPPRVRKAAEMLAERGAPVLSYKDLMNGAGSRTNLESLATMIADDVKEEYARWHQHPGLEEASFAARTARYLRQHPQILQQAFDRQFNPALAQINRRRAQRGAPPLAAN